MPRTLVFHRGALGDCILIWPLLRALHAADRNPTLITDGEKASLTTDELALPALDIEQPRFNALWSHAPATSAITNTTNPAINLAINPDPSVDLVISTLVPPVSALNNSPWPANTAAAFPRARLDLIESRLNRPLALDLARRYAPAAPLRAPSSSRLATHASPLSSPTSPLLLHVGAGSPAKRWPLDRWASLASALTQITPHPIHIIAGEVEADRFTTDERTLFNSLAGRFLPDLRALAHTIKSARAFISADSGPAHLAAQLGVPTLTLFGPTDPHLWAPIRPQDQTATDLPLTLAPPTPSPMTWLAPITVLNTITTQLLSPTTKANPF